MKRTLQLGIWGVLGTAAISATAWLSTPGIALAERHGGPMQSLENLNLTEAQRTEIDAIFATSRAEIQTVLTAEQRATFAETLADTDSYREAMRAINLSEDQRSAIWDMMREARAAIGEVLTAEQRQEIREAMRERHGERHGPGARGPGAGPRNPSLH